VTHVSGHRADAQGDSSFPVKLEPWRPSLGIVQDSALTLLAPLHPGFCLLILSDGSSGLQLTLSAERL
jgi:hypothetical protein